MNLFQVICNATLTAYRYSKNSKLSIIITEHQLIDTGVLSKETRRVPLGHMKHVPAVVIFYLTPAKPEI